jgi:thiol-disulfide isomerase/thioredoxin
MLTTLTLSLLLAPLAPQAAAPAAAPQEKPQPTLKAGDPAPALAMESWLKGKPVTGFEPGHVYVVEFWATWCGPCIASMPHISALQADYKDKVTVIGTNIWERPYDEKTLEKVTKFVADQGDRMAYTIAYDGPSATTDAAWMGAAARRGIPSAFIVDQKGTVAWMGHPAAMDFALHEIVAGTWDLAKGPEREKQALDALRAVGELAKTDAAGAQAAYDKLAKDMPFVVAHQDDLRLELLKAHGKWDDVYTVWKQRVELGVKQKDLFALSGVARAIIDPKATMPKRDFDLALRAAQTAVEISEFKSAGYLDLLAKVHAARGDFAKAIETQTKAVEVASEKSRPNYEKTLEEYKGKAAL